MIPYSERIQHTVTAPEDVAFLNYELINGRASTETAAQRIESSFSWNGVLGQLSSEPVAVDHLFVFDPESKQQVRTGLGANVTGVLGTLSLNSLEFFVEHRKDSPKTAITAEFNTAEGDRLVILSLDMGYSDMVRPIFKRESSIEAGETEAYGDRSRWSSTLKFIRRPAAGPNYKILM